MSAGRWPCPSRPSRSPGRVAAAALGVVLALAAGCGGGAHLQSAAAGSRGAATSATPAAGHGTVRVLYAGSLVNVMEHGIGPAFAAASGDHFEGYGAGSTQIANEIKGRIRPGDVFISADPAINATLQGAANGGWVSWYVRFARSPLVLGYNPKSRFAHQLATRPWYDVIAEPGFRLGRTDPTLDPKGKLTAQAIRQIAADRHRPALAGAILHNAQVFPEEELVGRLQSGQLDAGFFYSVETSDLRVPTVDLRPVTLAATYTVAVLAHGPDHAAAIDFVRYLLGPHGDKVLHAHGFTLVRLELTGSRSAVPASLRTLVAGRP